ncbi:hypothetical protein SMGD1_1913 [Sulfurimonas gotlandica GD1]|uniref:Uncharacterized protein n=1 Tax=Sulfurimonas gotlandica (strain DSM 19862 / JCM 16533 / GD1) TaxID=929558 RepID=B6BIS6_SULGG|nr:hypothetical protein [Sulfurimonas gotlandica]EDZ63444.1 hypothetical protein CBGD1_1064 [Sulfurimonas gotlandica GD1]EHP30436.1 hypothetical protein SMGD1_1913 [Sulfurimonas gotlandica GD1]
MKSREFKIHIDYLNLDYDDNLNMNLIEEYVIEDLEVPQDCIKSLEVYDNYVDIKLTANQRYFNDDWYVNLQRVV